MDHLIVLRKASTVPRDSLIEAFEDGVEVIQNGPFLLVPPIT